MNTNGTDSDARNLVLLMTFDSAAAAGIAQGMLMSHGIPTVIDNAVMNSVLPTGFNELRMMVRKQQYDEALKLLNDHGNR